jgi:hypothetical protein
LKNTSTKSSDPKTSPARHIALTIDIRLGIKKYGLFLRFIAYTKSKREKKLKTLP